MAKHKTNTPDDRQRIKQNQPRIHAFFRQLIWDTILDLSTKCKQKFAEGIGFLERHHLFAAEESSTLTLQVISSYAILDTS
jgi:hypothetical protein